MLFPDFADLSEIIFTFSLTVWTMAILAFCAKAEKNKKITFLRSVMVNQFYTCDLAYCI
jgi:hypothetical protein